MTVLPGGGGGKAKIAAVWTAKSSNLASHNRLRNYHHGICYRDQTHATQLRRNPSSN